MFITSWKNPGEDLSGIRFDDYLLPKASTRLSALPPNSARCRRCIWSVTASAARWSRPMAWASKHYAKDKLPVAHWTLVYNADRFLVRAISMSSSTRASIGALEESMAKKVISTAAEMASSFRLLRSNSLVWNYWCSYLLGDNLPAFDVLSGTWTPRARRRRCILLPARNVACTTT